MTNGNRMKTLYRIASIAAAVAVGGMVFDIVLSMAPGWGADTAQTTAAGWLQQLAENPLLGLRNLDLLNVVVSLVALPMYLAVTVLHRRERPASALLGLAFVGMGTALFAASNVALPMLELARQWVGAGVSAQAGLSAAADGLLARGAHGSLGAFPGFFLSELGTLSIAVAMLSGALIGRRVAWTGVIGAGSLLVYTVVMTFGAVPTSLVAALAAPGGILMIAWHVFVARALWVQARRIDREGSSATPAEKDAAAAASRWTA